MSDVGHSVDAGRDARGGPGRAERPAREPFIGLEDGRTVVAGEVRRSLVDNLTTRRSRCTRIRTTADGGTGRRCSPTWRQVARAHGRTMLDAEGAWAYDAGPEGRGARPRSSCTAARYRFGLGDVHRVLHLPVDRRPARRAGRRGCGAPRGVHDPLWVGRGARRHGREPCRPDRPLMVEAPTGDLSGSRRTPTSTRSAAPRRSRQAGAHGVHQRRPGRRRDVVAYSNLATTSTAPRTRSSGARWSAVRTAGTGSVSR